MAGGGGPAVPSRRGARRTAVERIAQHMRLAERLGAETHTLIGDDVRADAHRLCPVAKRHEDRRGQDRPAALEAIAVRHGRGRAGGPQRQHRCLCHPRRGRGRSAAASSRPSAGGRLEQLRAHRRGRGAVRPAGLAEPLLAACRSEHRHGVSAGSRLCGRALRPRSGHCGGGGERARLRLFVCAPISDVQCR